MFTKFRLSLVVLIMLLSVAAVASASHAWGNYHWARTANPFVLKLGDNVSTVWDGYLGGASTDWSLSSVLDTNLIKGGTRPRVCKPTAGRVEVCNSKYGFNGWLGVASIWVNGNHITQGTVKVNDSYFNTKKYNTAPWRRLVMCQEVGHTFGLDHQDENFSNVNLGTCMDYTNDPDGPLSNEHPNVHDYEELEAIYGHLDLTTTVGQLLAKSGKRADVDVLDALDSGRKIKRSLYERDLGNGKKLFTFVFWVE